MKRRDTVALIFGLLFSGVALGSLWFAVTGTLDWNFLSSRCPSAWSSSASPDSPSPAPATDPARPPHLLARQPRKVLLMTTPYPPQPRRLMRDPNKKLVGGVCAGLAKYLNMDVNLVRILAVVITLFTGIPIVLYLIALFVMPEEGATPPQPPYVNGPQQGAYDAGYPGQYAAQQPYGAQGQPAGRPGVGPRGAPWEQPQTDAPSPPAASAAGRPATTPLRPRPSTGTPEPDSAGTAHRSSRTPTGAGAHPEPGTDRPSRPATTPRLPTPLGREEGADAGAGWD